MLEYSTSLDGRDSFTVFTPPSCRKSWGIASGSGFVIVILPVPPGRFPGRLMGIYLRIIFRHFRLREIFR